MPKYIKSKDGKFAGSIGAGKNNPPRTFETYHPDYTNVQPLSTPTAPALSPATRDLADQLHTDIETLYIASTKSEDEHQRAITEMNSRARAARAAGHHHQHALWTRLSTAIDRGRKENWKPETTFLYVHWAQGNTARIAHADHTGTN